MSHEQNRGPDGRYEGPDIPFRMFDTVIACIVAGLLLLSAWNWFGVRGVNARLDQHESPQTTTARCP